MKKNILAITVLLSCTSLAHAGFFDFFTGGEDEEKAVTKTAPKAEVTTEAAIPKVATKPAQPVASSSTLKTATDMAMGLVPTLTKQLGITETQAEGGMGSLMQMAKGALSSNEFSELSKGVPGMDTLLDAAPSINSKSAAGGLTGMLSGAGGLASKLGGIAALSQQFEALGLSTEMISKFASMAIDYFSGDSESEGSTGDLLQKGLKGLLG